MSTVQTTSERDPRRWMTLYSVIVAVLATVLYGALTGLIAAGAGAGRDRRLALFRCEGAVRQMPYKYFYPDIRRNVMTTDKKQAQ